MISAAASCSTSRSSRSSTRPCARSARPRYVMLAFVAGATFAAGYGIGRPARRLRLRLEPRRGQRARPARGHDRRPERVRDAAGGRHGAGRPRLLFDPQRGSHLRWLTVGFAALLLLAGVLPHALARRPRRARRGAPGRGARRRPTPRPGAWSPPRSSVLASIFYFAVASPAGPRPGHRHRRGQRPHRHLEGRLAHGRGQARRSASAPATSRTPRSTTCSRRARSGSTSSSSTSPSVAHNAYLQVLAETGHRRPGAVPAADRRPASRPASGRSGGSADGDDQEGELLRGRRAGRHRRDPRRHTSSSPRSTRSTCGCCSASCPALLAISRAERRRVTPASPARPGARAPGAGPARQPRRPRRRRDARGRAGDPPRPRALRADASASRAGAIEVAARGAGRDRRWRGSTTRASRSSASSARSSRSVRPGSRLVRELRASWRPT